MGWAVSTHGGWRRSTSRNYVLLPPRWSFVTYSDEGGLLGGDHASMLLAALRSNDEDHALAQARTVRNEYTRIPNYVAYGGNDFQAGVYRVGESTKTWLFPPTTQCSLYDLIYTYLRGSPGRIHWLACTVHQ